MKTKNKNKKTEPETLFVAEQEPEKPAQPESEYRPNSKIQIPLKEDGTIDIDSMRAATKDRLKQALNSTPGLRDDPGQATVGMFPPQVVWAMYGTLGVAESLLVQRFLKVPRAVADQIFTYTPEEMALLTPPTIRVMSKYASEWMIKYQDEIALAGLLFTMTMAKVNAALMLAKQTGTVVEMPKREEPEEVKPN
jgi:hypothetical protein